MSLFWFRIHFPRPLRPHPTYISQNALYHSQRMCPHKTALTQLWAFLCQWREEGKDFPVWKKWAVPPSSNSTVSGKIYISASSEMNHSLYVWVFVCVCLVQNWSFKNFLLIDSHKIQSQMFTIDVLSVRSESHYHCPRIMLLFLTALIFWVPFFFFFLFKSQTRRGSSFIGGGGSWHLNRARTNNYLLLMRMGVI